MTTCIDFDTQTLVPALAFIRVNLKAIPPSIEEHTTLLAIAGQESGWSHRTQQPVAYAHSFWQFERGGILGLMRDDETSKQVVVLCGMAGVPFQSTAIWNYMAKSEADNFSAAMSRLLLWTDPSPLPKTMDDGFDYYVRNWRPGKPSETRWAAVYQQAVAAIAQGAHL